MPKTTFPAQKYSWGAKAFLLKRKQAREDFVRGSSAKEFIVISESKIGEGGRGLGR